MNKFLAIALIVLLSACTTVIESDKTKMLVVSSKMDKSIFLIPVTPSQRTVFIDIKNFTSYPFFELSEPIQQAMIEKRFKITNNPALAHFMIQANILDVKEFSKNNMSSYSITTDLKISQRIPESIYIRKLNETKQSKEDFAKMSFTYDDYEMTETLASDNTTSLFWKTYQTTISTITNETELNFNEAASTIISKLSDIIVSIF